LELEL
jgi:hypothetical protein